MELDKKTAEQQRAEYLQAIARRLPKPNRREKMLVERYARHAANRTPDAFDVRALVEETIEHIHNP